tara:strand:+ start:441 stop:965 length:525 start_codon:yes stop_codon:yes gene_type:complete
MSKRYKIFTDCNAPPYGGWTNESARYFPGGDRAGKWITPIEGKLVACRNGYHVCTKFTLMENVLMICFSGRTPLYVYEVETKEEERIAPAKNLLMKIQGKKRVCRSYRVMGFVGAVSISKAKSAIPIRTERLYAREMLDVPYRTLQKASVVLLHDLEKHPRCPNAPVQTTAIYR